MLEELIKQLDNRGLLVFQVLLGQQAMKILAEEKVEKHSNIITGNKTLPWKLDAKDIKNSII